MIAILKQAGITVDEETIKKFLSLLDKNGDGKVSLCELLEASRIPADFNQRVVKLFKLIDSNNNQKISQDELKAWFLSKGINLNSGVLTAFFGKYDLDHDGLIVLAEFQDLASRPEVLPFILKVTCSSTELGNLSNCTNQCACIYLELTPEQEA